MAKYTIKGEEVYRPYREFGYNEKAGGPDPNSKRQRAIRKKDKGGKKGDKGPVKLGIGKKGDSLDTVAAPPTVQEFSLTHSIDSKIGVLDGTNLRKLRDGQWLFPPRYTRSGQEATQTVLGGNKKIAIRDRRLYWLNIGSNQV